MITHESTINVEAFTPRRLLDDYWDKNDEILIASGKGVDLVRLRGVGRTVWLMLDGKHTISEIADSLCARFSTPERATVLDELLTLLLMLKGKNLIFANWDPLHKLNLSQELNENDRS